MGVCVEQGFWPCVRMSAGLGWCLTEGAHKKRADPERVTLGSALAHHTTLSTEGGRWPMTIVPDNKHNDLTTLGLDAQGFADLQELEALETTSAIERGDLAALFTGFVNFSLPVDSVDAGVYEWDRRFLPR